MRLVSCTACHTQYDVTRVTSKWVDCACGDRIENVAPVAIEQAVRRCSACGAPAESADASCAYCGAEPERDLRRLSLICPDCCARNAENARFCQGCGVVFHPQPVMHGAVEDGQTMLSDLPCPACKTQMPPRAVGGVMVHECPACNGLWTRGESFDRLIDKALDAKRAGDGSFEGFSPRVKGGNPARQKVEYRRCPECEEFMQRRNFRKTSGVIIDVCSHGTWLDMDELERIAGFLLSGGRPKADAFMRATEAGAEADYQSARRANIAAQYRSGTAGAVWRSSEIEATVDIGSTLFGILRSILD